MFRHRNCVTDPQAKTFWRDYQKGNPLGLSFTEYVATRVVANAPRTVTAAAQGTEAYYPAQCGHRHPWGVSCSNWTEA